MTQKRLAPASPFCVIAQTTFRAETYDRICRILLRKDPACEIFDSICRATADRQEEARHLAETCEALIVVGGRHSANTCRLAEIGRAAEKPTFHVETADELDPDALARFDRIGITAGASTPPWITEKVVAAVKAMNGAAQA
jgi:4-hydroxy-3-methylbut-2-en-1-yl diphosphate reductase